MHTKEEVELFLLARGSPRHGAVGLRNQHGLIEVVGDLKRIIETGENANRPSIRIRREHGAVC